MKGSRLTTVATLLTLLLSACGPGATPTASPSPIRATSPAPQATATPRPSAGATALPGTPTPAAAAAPTKPVPTAPKYGGVVRIAQLQDLREPDPFTILSLGTFDRAMNSWIFNRAAAGQAVKGKPCEYNLRPDAAESWKWANDTTFEVTFRKGIKYHNKPPVNGREMVAQDYVTGLARQKHAKERTILDSYVSRIETPDNYTVRFSFSKPWGAFARDVLGGFTVIAPPEAADPKTGYLDPTKSWIGTGPMVLKDYIPGVKLGYAKNTNYFKAGLPYVDGVEIYHIGDVSTRMAALLGGKVTIADRLSPSITEALARSAPQMQLLECPLSAMQLTMRLNKAPFNDVRVRRAISMAVDRQTIIDRVFQKGVHVFALHPASNAEYFLSLEGYPPEVRKYLEYHPDESKKLLAEAGFPQGFKTTIRWSLYWGSPRTEMAEAVLDMLRKVGIDARFDIQERGAYTNTTTLGDYPEMAIMGYVQTYSADAVLQDKLSTAPISVNRIYLADPEYDRMVRSLIASIDETARKRLANEVQQYVAREALWLPLPTHMSFIGAWPEVRDLVPYDPNVEMGQMWENLWLDR